MKAVDGNLKPKDFLVTIDQKKLKELIESVTKLSALDAYE